MPDKETIGDQESACLIKLSNAGDTCHYSNTLPMDNQSDWDAQALDLSLLQNNHRLTYFRYYLIFPVTYIVQLTPVALCTTDVHFCSSHMEIMTQLW